MIVTFESRVKHGNKWISLASGDSEPLRKASIASLLSAVSQSNDLKLSVSVCWYFDGSGAKAGYKLTVSVSDESGDGFDVFPTTKYPFTQQRIFKTFEAVEKFCISLNFESIRVDFG